MTTWQAAEVAPVDVELWGTGHLRAYLAARPETYAAGVYVGNRKPSSNRPLTIVLRRDGGDSRGLIDNPRLTARIWGDNEGEVIGLSRLVVAAFNVAAGNGPCLSVTNILGPSPVPDDAQHERLVNVELRMRSDVF